MFEAQQRMMDTAMYQHNSFANNNMFCQTIEATNNFGPTQSSHQDLKTISANDDIMVPRRSNIIPQRIPCRARGIPGKHDASNAYIEIPPNAKHGTLLTCSAPNCVLTGRLFQFCAVCQLPVSKANFSKRHGHGMKGSSLKSASSEGALPSKTYMTNNEFVAASSSIQQGRKRSMSMLEAARPVNKMNSLEPQNEAWPQTTTTKPQKAVSMKASEEEIRWIYLWKNRPSPSASPEDHRRWFKQVEQHSGISLNALELNKQDSNIVPPETPSSDCSQSTKTSLPGTDKAISPMSNASLGSKYDPSKSSNNPLLASVYSKTTSATKKPTTNDSTMLSLMNYSTPLKPNDRLLEAAWKTSRDPNPFSFLPPSPDSSSAQKDSTSVFKQKLNSINPIIWESEDCLMAKDDLSDIEDIWDEDNEDDYMSDISTNKEDLGKYSSMPIPADIFN